MRNLNLNPARTPIGLRAVAPVSRFLFLAVVFTPARGWTTAGRRGCEPGLLQNFARLLRARLHQQGAQPADRSLLLADQLDQITQGLNRGFQLLIIFLPQTVPAAPAPAALPTLRSS